MNRIEKLKEFLTGNPHDNFIRHALALEYVKLENDNEARQLFEGILQDDPKYIGTYYHLGKLYERAGQGKEAIEVYETGMKFAKEANDRHAYNELQSACEELSDEN